jgi:hypothetical protein
MPDWNSFPYRLKQNIPINQQIATEGEIFRRQLSDADMTFGVFRNREAAKVAEKTRPYPSVFQL